VEKIKQQNADEFYKLIGMYIVAFQDIIYDLQDMIESIILNQNNSNQSQSEKIKNMCKIIYKKTAGQILEIWLNKINQTYSPNEDDSIEIKKICDMIKKQIDYRNFLIHGETLFCINDPDAQIIQMKLHKDDNKYKVIYNKFDKKYLLKQLETVNYIDDSLDSLEDYFFEKHYKKDNMNLADYIKNDNE